MGRQEGVFPLVGGGIAISRTPRTQEKNMAWELRGTLTDVAFGRTESSNLFKVAC